MKASFSTSRTDSAPAGTATRRLERLDTVIMTKPVNHVIDADIKGFFDNVSPFLDAEVPGAQDEVTRTCCA